jgi:hypothetical protein
MSEFRFDTLNEREFDRFYARITRDYRKFCESYRSISNLNRVSNLEIITIVRIYEAIICKKRETLEVESNFQYVKNNKFDYHILLSLLCASKMKETRKEKGSETSNAALNEFRAALDIIVNSKTLTKTAKVAELYRYQREITRRVASLKKRREQMSLPKEIPLYADRKDRSQDPEEFLKRAYKNYLGKGLAYADIKRSDPQLYKSLSVWCSEHKKKASSLFKDPSP